MVCNKCGMEIQGDAMFCPNCGNRVDAAIPQGNVMFCPNCGTENSVEDAFCKECGMPLSGPAYSVSVAGQGADALLEGQKPKKKRGLLIGIGAAAALAVVIGVVAVVMGGLFMSPGDKVLRAAADTLKDTPQMVNDLKAIPDILGGSQYTVGFAAEEDGSGISGEFRSTVDEKQIYCNADVDGDEGGEIDFLCGVHSGVLKAAVSELDYIFVYDPQGENDGYLCEQFRKKELEEFNSMLENITAEKVTAAEIKKDITAAFVQEFKELEFKEVKAKKFEVDQKDRECEGYRVRVDEKNIAHMLQNAGGRISGKLAEDARDNFEDMMDDLIDEVENDEDDMDITFYLYKGKLAAVIFEMSDYSEEEIHIEFQGGDYRMQNMLIADEYDGDVLAEISINIHEKGGKETIEIDLDGDEEAVITYDTKSGAVSLEYDTDWGDYLIEGIYQHSGSEASFALEEYEYDGESLMDEYDVSFTAYVKKNVQMEKYSGEEFDLGAADEDDFEELAEDLDEDFLDIVRSSINMLIYRSRLYDMYNM